MFSLRYGQTGRMEFRIVTETGTAPELRGALMVDGRAVRLEPSGAAALLVPVVPPGVYLMEVRCGGATVLYSELEVKPSPLPPGDEAGVVQWTVNADLTQALAVVEVHLHEGPQGEQGIQGVQGYSAYEVAAQHGYLGTEAEWVAELSGAQAAANTAKTQAEAAAASATAAGASATQAGNAQTAAETAAGNAANAQSAAESAAGEAGTSATASATQAGNAAASATAAGESATAAATQAGNAAASATAAGESATAAATQAEAAAASAEAAAQSAETSADAAENVKRDLLPVSLSWLNSLFARELGEENFTLSLSPEEAVLEVAFPYETEQTLRESLLGMCDRVCPAAVQVAESWLPAGWQELEYLKSSGTQYIDTGIVTDGTYTIACRMQISYGSAWGRAQTTKDSSLTEGTSWARYLSGSNAGLNFYYRRQEVVLNVSTDSSPSWDLTETHDWVAVEERDTVTLDGQTATTKNLNGRKLDASNPGSLSHFIFWASGEYPTGNGKAGMQLYRFTMSTADGAPVFDGVPVLNADGEAGILDRVSKRFLSNAGSGTFGYRIKATGEVVAPNASTYSLRGTRDPYYVAPSGVWARPVGEKELELVADTEEVDGEDWLHFEDSAAAEEYFGIVSEEE